MRARESLLPVTLVAALLFCAAGCASDRFTESAPFSKDLAEVWKATRETIEPYGIEREDEQKGEIESRWQGTSGLLRFEGTRKKILAVVEKRETGIVSKIMVRQESNSTQLVGGNEEAVLWQDDGFDTEMEDALLSRITMKLTKGEIEDSIRERLKRRPDLDELDRKIEEYRKKQEEEEEKRRED